MKQIKNQVTTDLQDKEYLVTRLYRDQMEMDYRCGDGTGKITSHSTNCICDLLIPEIEKTKKQLGNFARSQDGATRDVLINGSFRK